jgi:Fe-S-cluster containining protein
MEARKKTNGVWYARGLRFECQPDCANCCVNHGEYAYVYLERGDAQRLARHLRLKPAEFRKRYTEDDEDYVFLRMDDPACPFLDGRRCTVYPARPTQCRTFPFWRSHLTSPGAWKRLSGFCPGIDRGALHSQRTIEERVCELEPENETA